MGNFKEGKQHTILIFPFLFLLFLFFACRKEDEIPPAKLFYGYSYSPLALGDTKEYQVDSIVYDDFGISVSIDSFSYKLKEVYLSEFLDGADRPSFKVARYLQFDTAQSWKLDRISSRTKTSSSLEQFDNNQSRVILIFPVKEGEQWDANAKNTLQEQEYEYLDVHLPYKVNQFSFDSSLKVVQLDEENLLQQYYSEEVYATGVGMVEKTVKMLNTDLQGNIKNGYSLKYQIIAY